MLSYFLSNLVDHIPSAVVVCDTNGEIKKHNRRAVELWGREPKEGEKLASFYKLYTQNGAKIAPDDSPIFKAMKTRTSLRNQIVIFEREDTTRITVLANIDPVLNNGELHGAVAVFQDILITPKPRKIAVVNNDEKAAACVAALLRLRGHDASVISVNKAGENHADFYLTLTPEISKTLQREERLKQSLVVSLREQPDTLKQLLGE